MEKNSNLRNIELISGFSFLLNAGIDIIQDHPQWYIPLGHFLRARAHEITTPALYYFVVDNMLEYIQKRPPTPLQRLIVATGIIGLYTAYEFGVIATLLHTTFTPDPERILDLITVGTTLIIAYIYDLIKTNGTDNDYTYNY